ncbi:MAG: InlB B-repeat-containing protein [Balneolaceae bacterium]
MRRLLIFPVLAGLVLLSSCLTESTQVYFLTTNVSPAEAGTVTPAEGEYDAGTSVSITAAPSEEHWVFSGWQGAHSGSENPVIIRMNSDKELTATFVKRDYPLTVEVEGGGSVTETVISTKTTDYAHGTMVQLTAEPDDEWAFARWSGDLEGEENPQTITVDEAKSVTAIFERTYTLVTVVFPEDGGTVEPAEGTYRTGTNIDVEAIPASDGWRFDRWQGDFTGSTNPFSLTMNGNKTLEAHFERREYTLELTSEGQGTLSTELISGTETDDGYLYESEVEITASPDENWDFIRWEGDIESIENPIQVSIEEDMEIHAVFTQFEGGDGTPADPYQVATPQHLQRVSLFPDSHFLQVAEIDASETTGWDDGKGFDPIGSMATGFSGRYDGNGHTIQNLYINRGIGQTEPLGIFRKIESEGEVVNFRIEEAEITAVCLMDPCDAGTGGIAGLNLGRISGVLATGIQLNGPVKTGAVAGVNGGEIEESGASGSVEGESQAGGLVGTNPGTIRESWSTGSVLADSRAGGLTGENSGVIVDSWSTARAEVDELTGSEAGGLTGVNTVTGSITTSWSAGMVTGNSDTGGLTGVNDGSVSSSYWDTESSGHADGTGTGDATGSTGLTTVEMSGTDAETNMPEFDWATIWRTTAEYPELEWQQE